MQHCRVCTPEDRKPITFIGFYTIFRAERLWRSGLLLAEVGTYSTSCARPLFGYHPANSLIEEAGRSAQLSAVAHAAWSCLMDVAVCAHVALHSARMLPNSMTSATEHGPAISIASLRRGFAVRLSSGAPRPRRLVSSKSEVHPQTRPVMIRPQLQLRTQLALACS